MQACRSSDARRSTTRRQGRSAIRCPRAAWRAAGRSMLKRAACVCTRAATLAGRHLHRYVMEPAACHDLFRGATLDQIAKPARPGDREPLHCRETDLLQRKGPARKLALTDRSGRCPSRRQLSVQAIKREANPCLMFCAPFRFHCIGQFLEEFPSLPLIRKQESQNIGYAVVSGRFSLETDRQTLMSGV